MKYIFDLDFTLWESNDKFGNPIWVKQMIPPFSLKSKNVLIDDVYSVCRLKCNVREMLFELRSRGDMIGFITNSEYSGLPKELQPSLLVLEQFDILKYFNSVKIIQYKDRSKYESLISISEEKFRFYDDDIKNLI